MHRHHLNSFAALSVLSAILVLCASVPSKERPLLPEQEASRQDRPASRLAADGAQVDKTIKALYDVISGPKGKQRDWDRFRSLCVEGCTFTGVRHEAPDRARSHRMTVEEYIKRAGPFLEESGFFEREMHRKLEIFGNVAHAFSTYASFNEEGKKIPFARGINSIQLLKTPSGWKIFSVLWQQEATFIPIPAAYLPSEKKDG